MYKHAICAPRTSRRAGFPAVANHQQMCVVCHPRRQLRFEYCVRPFGRCARREQVQSCCDPMDMGVDWHRVATQVEHQDAGRRLRPDPVEGHQPVACLLDLHCAEERQIVAAGAVTDRAEDCLNTWGFAVGEATTADCVGDLADRSVDHRIPVREALLQ